MSEYESEPIPGLPAHLPEGEQLLWQGSPAAMAIARRALHVGLVAAYFGILLVWRVMTGVSDGMTAAEIALNSVPLLLAAAASLALLALLAYFIARTTIYSITSRRVVMRYGVALPIAVNLPFTSIQKADAMSLSDGSGDIVLSVGKMKQLGYLHLWPHARAWHVRQPQPMLRGLADVATVSSILSRALHAAAGQPARAIQLQAGKPAAAGAQVEPQAHAAA